MGEYVCALRPPFCVWDVYYTYCCWFFCFFACLGARPTLPRIVGSGWGMDACCSNWRGKPGQRTDGRTGWDAGTGGGVGIGMRIYGSGSVYFARGGRQGTSERRGEMIDGVGASTYIHIPICASLFLYLLFSLLPLFQRMCSNN